MPRWAQDLSHKIHSQAVSAFIIYNNVRDLIAHRKDDKSDYLDLGDYLAEVVFKDRNFVVFYDISKGIYFTDKVMQSEFFRTMQLTQKDLMRSTSISLKAIEIFIRLRIDKSQSVAVVIDHAEMVAPSTISMAMAQEDRKCLVMLKKWAHDPNYMENKISICMITDNLSNINHTLVRNIAIDKIEVPYPEQSERLDFIQWFIDRERNNAQLSYRFADYSDVEPRMIAHSMAGLNCIQLNRFLAFARENRKRIDPGYIIEMKKEIIEEECFGLLEILEPRQTLDAVVGYEPIKERLRNLVHTIKKGIFDAVPMGYLFSGPVGTGKTFIVLSFVGEIGIPCVKFLNFREKWQGVTESNLEKILNLLKAMYPVGVIIDEADAFLGNRSQDGDSGTSSRIFAQLASFMGDTFYRGKVIWFLITCRPDLLPVDMKRQGRAEEHISVFYPESAEDKQKLFETLARRAGLNLPDQMKLDDIFDVDQAVSGADMEALITRVKLRLVTSGQSEVSREMLKSVFSDFIPTNDPANIELQNLAAVLECTSRKLIPVKYASVDRGEIRRRFEAFKLGES